jgi:hypothetical protein
LSTSILLGNGNGSFTTTSVTTPVTTLVTPSGHPNHAGRGLAVAAAHAHGKPFAAAGSADGTVSISATTATTLNQVLVEDV